MATYDPPQPLWKRNVAGVLDFLLALVVFGFLFNKLMGHQPHPPVINSGVVATEVVADAHVTDPVRFAVLESL